MKSELEETRGRRLILKDTKMCLKANKRQIGKRLMVLWKKYVTLNMKKKKDLKIYRKWNVHGKGLRMKSNFLVHAKEDQGRHG